MKKRLPLFLVILLITATHCTAQDFSSSLTSSLNDLNDRIDQVIAHPLPQSPIPQEATKQTSNSLQTSPPTNPSALPQAPNPQQPKEQETHDPQFESLYWAGIFCGAGATQSSATTPLIGCGVGISLFPFTFIEGGGIIDPTKSRGPGYFSVDGKIPLTIHGPLYVPNVIIGYTRFAKTADAKAANALDYGIAFDTPALPHKKSAEPAYIRIELRDYYAFATPNQHNVMLRIGLMAGLADP